MVDVDSPGMAQQAELLDRLLAKMPEGAKPVLHSDMGCSTSTPHGAGG